MIAGLKPYPEYKDSGISWLGNIPSHWETGPGMSCFREKQVKNTGMKEKTVLSLSYGHIVIKPPEKLHGLVPESFETYQIVDPGDIIIRSTDLQNDWNSLRIGLVQNRGIITSAYLCFRTTEKLSPEYGYLLLHAFDLMKVYYGMGSGLRQNLEYADFKRLLVVIPPLSEQAVIVRFLDRTTARIELAIRSKRKVVALLNEQKQVIIHRAVTYGVEKNATLKPSDTPWLKEMPESWQIVTLRRYLRPFDGIKIGPFGSQIKLSDMTTSGFKVYGQANVISNNFDAGSKFINKKKFDELSQCEILEGDVVITMMGTGGRCSIVPHSAVVGIMDSHLLRLRLIKEKLAPNFLALVVDKAPYIKTQIFISSKGSIMQGLNSSMIKNLSILLPPLDEQLNIVDTIKKELSPLNVAIEYLEREIELLKEYRLRLTADIVTGKFDIREAASHLPTVAQSSVGIDELATEESPSEKEIDDEEAEA